MSIIESIIYGFVSGMTEVFPVSSQANQLVMRQLFGVMEKEPIRDMLVHIAALAALLLSCRGLIKKIRREQVLAYRMRRNPSQVRALKGVYDMRLVRSAAPIMLIGLFLGFFIPNLYDKRPLFALILLINGAITMIPVYLHHGNRDARIMTGLDGILIGFAAALSAIPGISRNGAIMSVSLVREADKQNGLIWALLLSIPALVMLTFLDFIAIFTVGVGTLTLALFAGYLISMLSAFAGTYMAVTVIRKLVTHSDLGGFAYYDFGLALFSFILYLIV